MALPDPIRLRPPAPFDVTLSPPGSKSLSNRALLLAALAEGTSTLRNLLEADDTRHMRACLATLGVELLDFPDADGTLAVEGLAGPLRSTVQSAPGLPPTLHVGTAGTVARLLGAVVAASPVHAIIDGTPRMRERPMAQLLDALRDQGARLTTRGEPGCLPVEVGPDGPRLRGGTITLARPASSQIVSGLVIAALLAAAPTRIVLEQGTPARPYVDMTLATVQAFGGHARWLDARTLEIEPSSLRAIDTTIEPDASAASYPLALAALYGGHCTIAGLGHDSLQGDVAFAPAVLAPMGAAVDQAAHQTSVRGAGPLRGGDFDLGEMPDMTLTLAALAIHARGPTRIRGVAILRHHESDRLAAAATELRKLGATVHEHPDGLDIHPPSGGPRAGVTVDTYEDHRMAMAFALVGDVGVRDPGCVAKTWPEYFSVLERLGMVVSSAR
ncbi:3-phosphoshikimate 1-carboxyvinyltransferase [Paraliomyxa miuraensis]|uniref:3-phosphoshikimate 1-carboxyvinyltransferase n=1 Tax=Paraliomyxa miuraensis TaxID=376150 RepID=UPI002250CC7E|nr:3-phosphoshikimate 1-carboxyvinyltransferase [Paraliomyxa miuraensis]MCX4247888.1 3-phosphoshikimate 1-carboxyvinyltransferase [Paraliomyxa miuraensis]